MRIFISKASQQHSMAEEIALALRGDHHTVFLDDTDLPAGNSYHERIRSAIDKADIMVFLVSPESVAPGRYTLSELKFARNKWPHPRNRVLPVMAAKMPMDVIPPYLRAVTIYKPRGDLAAEVAYEVQRMVRPAKAAAKLGLFASSLLGAGIPGNRKSKSESPSNVASSFAYNMSKSVPWLWASVAVFFAVGLLAGLISFYLQMGVEHMPLVHGPGRGLLFALVVCLLLVYFDVGSPRRLAIAFGSTLGAFLVAALVSQFILNIDLPAKHLVAGALRAALLAYGLSFAVPQPSNNVYVLSVAAIGAAAGLLFGLDLAANNSPSEIPCALWEAAVAGALTYWIARTVSAHRPPKKRGREDRVALPGPRPDNRRP